MRKSIRVAPRAHEVSSHKNPLFLLWKSLLTSKGIRDEKLCLVAGTKQVRELLKDFSDLIESQVVAEKMTPLDGPDRVCVLTPALFSQLDTSGTQSPLLVVKTPQLRELNLPLDGWAIASALADPVNQGALLRTSESFGFKNLILLRESANPFLPKALRAGANAAFRLKLFRGPSIQDLDAPNTFALDLKGRPINEIDYPKNGILLVGEEGQGVPSTFHQVTRIHIPMRGQSESLNAAVAAGIFLFHLSQGSKPLRKS